jgi:hypothetical protein
MSAVHKVVDPLMVRVLSLLGNLVVLPFAIAGRRHHH